MTVSRQERYESDPREPITGSLESSLGAALVVTSYRGHAELIAAVLNSLSQVTHADSPGKAFAAIQQGSFGLIILDIGFPKSAETIDLLKRRTSAGLIVISGADPTLSVAEALDLGADDYVLFPVRPAELRARARAVTRRTQVIHRGFQSSSGTW